jgi:hypothetical protein
VSLFTASILGIVAMQMLINKNSTAS